MFGRLLARASLVLVAENLVSFLQLGLLLLPRPPHRHGFPHPRLLVLRVLLIREVPGYMCQQYFAKVFFSLLTLWTSIPIAGVLNMFKHLFSIVP